METTEQLVKLTPDDVALLQGRKASGKGCGAVALVIFALIAGIIYGSPGLRSLHLNVVSLFEAGLILVLLFVGFITFAVKNGNRSLSKNIDKDLKEGYKKVVARRVEAQEMESHEVRSDSLGSPGRKTGSIAMTFALKIGGKYYRADEGLYMKVRPGDTIVSHVAPNSGLTLYHTPASGDERFPPSALEPLTGRNWEQKARSGQAGDAGPQTA